MMFWVSSPVVSTSSIGKYMNVAKPSPTHAGNHELVALGLRIRLLRQNLGFSQEAFADEIGIDRSYVGGIERGEHNFSMINLLKISQALKIPASKLLDEAGL
jgi:DNA-binding XRE family transcriptional regulator